MQPEHDWTPTEAEMFRGVVASLENPMGWYFENLGVLHLIVAEVGSPLDIARVRRYRAHA